MKNKSIRYVIGSSDAWASINCYDAGIYGTLNLISTTIDNYCWDYMPDILFCDTRQEARDIRNKHINEDVYKVEVNSKNKITKWIKKNP